MRKFYNFFFESKPIETLEEQVLEAAKRRDWKYLDSLLSSKQNVATNKDKCTVWHYAVADAQNEILRRLISLDIKGIHHRDINGNSATHYAVIYDNPEGLEILLNSKQNTFFTVNNRRESVLHIAAKKGDVAMLTMIISSLKEARQKLDNPECDGNTALHLATSHGHLESVKLLLEQGVSVNTCNNAHQTPYDLAALKFPTNLELKSLLNPDKECPIQIQSTKRNY